MNLLRRLPYYLRLPDLCDPSKTNQFTNKTHWFFPSAGATKIHLWHPRRERCLWLHLFSCQRHIPTPQTEIRQTNWPQNQPVWKGIRGTNLPVRQPLVGGGVWVFREVSFTSLFIWIIERYNFTKIHTNFHLSNIYAIKSSASSWI